jgi:esterase
LSHLAATPLAFEEFGSADSPPLIILHGFLASSRNWRYIAQKLAENYRVFVLDLRNHGASPHTPVMDYPSMAHDVVYFLEQHHLAKTNLLGHSMGGKIAMWFALCHPNRVNKLIIADIAPVSYKHSFKHTLEALKALPLAALNNRKQAESLLAPAIPELSYRQFLLQNLMLQKEGYQWRINLDIFSQASHHIAAFPDLGDLAPYPKEALFIAGSDSKFVSAEMINPVFPKAILNVIENAGHWLHVQQPAQFIDRVNNFLSRH